MDALDTRRRQVDLLAKMPTDHGGEEMVLVHVEVEGQARNEMSRRMWQYAMLLRNRHDLPLIPLVVYLRGGKPGVHKETHTEVVMGEDMVHFYYFAFGRRWTDTEPRRASGSMSYSSPGPVRCQGLPPFQNRRMVERYVVEGEDQIQECGEVG